MKRSDALKILVQTHGAYDSWKEQCDYMLKQLELIGMLPPDNCQSGLCANANVPCGNNWEEERVE